MSRRELFDDVPGQERAIATLRNAATSPVHAYLLVGPPGSGKRAAARSFAAALLCRNGGCGVCRDCTLARAELHPDVHLVERVGPFITVEQARDLTVLASRTPVESSRKVIVPVDFHLLREAAAALLKTIEEPPASTVFVILAEHVPLELVTIASRCVRVEFAPVPSDLVVAALVAEGVDPALAEEVAGAAGGRLDRARLLASDPGFAARREVWRSVPARLDGTGAQVAAAVDQLMAVLDSASVQPLRERHAAEVAELQSRVEQFGLRGSGKKDLDDRHKRELKRLRDDELRFGLATLAAAYRHRLDHQGHQSDTRAALDALAAIDRVADSLERNPNQALLLQALLLHLSARVS